MVKVETPTPEALQAASLLLQQIAGRGDRIGRLNPATRRSLATELAFLKRRDSAWNALLDVAELVRREVLEDSVRDDDDTPRSVYKARLDGMALFLGTLSQLVDSAMAEEKAVREEEAAPDLAALIGSATEMSL